MKQGWTYKQLGEIATFIKDGDWIESKDQSESGIRLIQTGNVGYGVFKIKNDKPHYITEETMARLGCTEIFEGDCLVSRLPNPVGRACLIPDIGCRMITAVDCSIIRFGKDYLPQFFVYYTQSYKYLNSIDEKTTGTTRKRISRKNLEKIQIPLPPLSEQERIVERLDAAFAQIDELRSNAERQLADARALFQSALKEMLEPKEGWVEKKMSELYDVRDGTHDSPKYHETGYPLVTSKNLRGGILDMSNVSLISEEDYKAINIRSKVDIGDVLFAMIGTIGNPVYVQTEPNYAIKNMALFKVPPTQSGEFLRYYLLNNNVLLKMQNESKGTTQKFVSLGYLRNFLVRIPNLSEQKQLVSRLDSLKSKVDCLQENFTKISQECDAMKQALLRQIFE